MHVIFLCAGYATRLYPLTVDKPKPLLPVGNKPMLEWTLQKLEEIEGVESVNVVTNHRFSGQFENWKKHLKSPFELFVVDDHTTTNEDRLGAIGDLAYVIRERKLARKDLLVIAGDNLFDFNMKVFMDFAEARRPYPVLAVYDVQTKELARKYGLLRHEQGGRVVEFYEKPENPITTLASCGIYWLPAEASSLLEQYLEGGNNPDQPGHYMRWLAQQHALYAIALTGQWLDIGDIDSYKKADELFRAIKD